MIARLREKRLRWMLRKIIRTLEEKVKYGVSKDVVSFAKSLEATSIMARGTKIDTEVSISCTRRELDSFIRYITIIHDEKLTRLEQARIGLATLILKDQNALGDDPKKVLGGAAKAIKDGRRPSVLVSNAFGGARKIRMSPYAGGRRKKR